IFNIYGLLSLGLGIAIAVAIGKATHPVFGIMAGAAVAAGIDLLQRLGNREDVPAPLVNAEAGGPRFFERDDHSLRSWRSARAAGDGQWRHVSEKRLWRIDGHLSDQCGS